MKKILFFFSASLLLLACAKHNGDLEDTMPQASLRIDNPIQGAVFAAGDSIRMTGSALSTATIHGYDVIVRKQSDTARIYFAHFHQHNDTLSIDTGWRANVAAGAYQAEVVLYLDHDGHTLNRKVGFFVK